MLIKKGSWFDSANLLPLFVLGTGALQVVTLFVVAILSIGLWSLAKKPTPSLVQLADGRSIAAEPVRSTYRPPIQIHNFVKESLGILFSWNANITPEVSANGKPVKSKLDPGVQVKTGRITTAVWEMQQVIRDDFRIEMVETIARMTPSGVFGNTAQTVLSIEEVSVPKPVSNHLSRWTVDVVATLIIFDEQNPQGRPVRFNKAVYVEAVEPTTDPLPENSTAVQKAVYRQKEKGLRIYDMHDLEIN